MTRIRLHYMSPPNAIQAFPSLPSMRLTPLIHSAANTRLPNALHIETQPFQLGDIDDIASAKDRHGSPHQSSNLGQMLSFTLFSLIGQWSKQFRIGVDLAEWTAALGLSSFQAGLHFLRGKIWLIICGHVRFLLNQVSEGRP